MVIMFSKFHSNLSKYVDAGTNRYKVKAILSDLLMISVSSLYIFLNKFSIVYINR